MKKYIGIVDEYERYGDGARRVEMVEGETIGESLFNLQVFGAEDYETMEEMYKDDDFSNYKEWMENCEDRNGNGWEYVELWEEKKDGDFKKAWPKG